MQTYDSPQLTCHQFLNAIKYYTICKVRISHTLILLL